MKIKKTILFVLASMFLLSLVICMRNCILYEKAVQNTANAEKYREQLEQWDSDRAASDWHYYADLSATYSAQRRDTRENIERAQEKIWEQKDIEEVLSIKASCSALIAVAVFIVICVFYLKAIKKPNKTINQRRKSI